MKKLPLVLSMLILIAIPTTSYASNIEKAAIENTIIEEADNGCYYKTIIETYPFVSTNDLHQLINSSKTKTGRSTTTFYNSAGKALWYVQVTGTFSYGNGSSKCIKSVASAASQNASWKIASKTASKTGNTAKATATATEYNAGIVISSVTKSATLTCTPDGHLSSR